MISIAPQLQGRAASFCRAEKQAIDLNQLTGKIYQVNFAAQSINFITETAYDPKFNEGETRHTIYWNDQTKFVLATPLYAFDSLTGPSVGHFYLEEKGSDALKKDADALKYLKYLEKKDADELKNGRGFSARYVDILDPSTKVTGLSADGKERNKVGHEFAGGQAPRGVAAPAPLVFELVEAVFGIGSVAVVFRHDFGGKDHEIKRGDEDGDFSAPWGGLGVPALAFGMGQEGLAVFSSARFSGFSDGGSGGVFSH